MARVIYQFECPECGENLRAKSRDLYGTVQVIVTECVPCGREWQVTIGIVEVGEAK